MMINEFKVGPDSISIHKTVLWFFISQLIWICGYYIAVASVVFVHKKFFLGTAANLDFIYFSGLGGVLVLTSVILLPTFVFRQTDQWIIVKDNELILFPKRLPEIPLVSTKRKISVKHLKRIAVNPDGSGRIVISPVFSIVLSQRTKEEWSRLLEQLKAANSKIYLEKENQFFIAKVATLTLILLLIEFSVQYLKYADIKHTILVVALAAVPTAIFSYRATMINHGNPAKMW